MTKQEFSQAWQLARSNTDLSRVNDLPLHGLALPDFKQVTVTIESVAVFLRWQCICLDGSIDTEELANIAELCKRKVIIC